MQHDFVTLNDAQMSSLSDQFGLYYRIERVARLLAIYELIKQTLDCPGDIMEFGCWCGSNLLYMAKVLKVLQPHTIKKVYGFDSFEGLKTVCEKDNGFNKEFAGEYVGNEENLKSYIKLNMLEGVVCLVKGDATKTIREFEAKFNSLISLAYLDFDLYLPTKEALNFVNKRLSNNGLIVFDEAMLPEWEGESRAMLEFLDENSGKYETTHIPFARYPTVALKRIK